jgi:hypothetical protein
MHELKFSFATQQKLTLCVHITSWSLIPLVPICIYFVEDDIRECE